MEIEFLDGEFSICKYEKPVMPSEGFVFTAKTDNEFSLVCESRYVPDGWTDREDGWTAFRIAGQLDFSLVGILSKISGILADEGISVFAISTYDTDYILIKNEMKERCALKLKSL